MNDLPTVASDSALKRRHREHQGTWRESQGWPAGPPSDRRSRERYGLLTNYFAEEHGGQTPEQAGINLVPPTAAGYARARMSRLEAIEGVAEADRLWRNLLSSQPLAFSIAGHLGENQEAAAEVFARLTGLDVVSFARMEDPDAPQHTLDGIEAEWFPPREHHTNDRSGFDIAALMTLADGTHTLLTVEVKYVDTFSSAELDPSREEYAAALDRCGVDHATADDLVSAGGSQFLRSVLLTDSVQRNGIAGSTTPLPDRAVAVVLGRRDDYKAQEVVKRFERVKPPATSTAFWSHDQFLDAVAASSSLSNWAASLRERYILGT